MVRDQSEDESSARWRIELEPRTEADDWNAEVSLLTGMCAGRMMIDAGIGLLRTLPPAEGVRGSDLAENCSGAGYHVAGGAKRRADSCRTRFQRAVDDGADVGCTVVAARGRLRRPSTADYRS